jgi:hypothetical protein
MTTSHVPTRLRPLQTAQHAAVVGLAVLGVLCALRLLVALFGVTSPAAGRLAQDGLSVLGLVYAAGFLYTAAAFMTWLHIARTNLDAQGQLGLRWAPGWTVGGWFIPFANLVIPVRVVGEVAARSEHELQDVNRIPGRVLRWWLAFLLSLFHFSFTTVDAAGAVTVLPSTFFWEGLNGLAGIVAAILAIGIVRRVSALQAAWIELPAPQLPSLA